MKINKEKIIYILILILEVFGTIFFSKNILDIITTKAYNGYFPLKNIIFAIILGICILSIIIYIYMKNREKLENIFLPIGIAIGVCFAIFILPFNVPDEETHLIKSYDISVGHFLPQIDEDGRSFCTVPKKIETCTCLAFNSYSDIYKELNETTDYNNTIKINCNAQGNSFLLYIGPVTSIIFCRLFNINILYAMYIGRILNLLIFLIFMYFAIKKIPFGKLVLAILSFFPIMMQQVSSCSADAILNAVLIFYIVYLIHLVFKEDKISLKEKISLFVMTALIAIFKYIYILVAGILFLILFKNKADRKDNIKTIGIMIVIGSIFMVGWYVFNLRYDATPENIKEYYKTLNIDSTSQINFLKEHPFRICFILAKQFIIYGTDTIYSTVGSFLGWLNVEINSGVSLGFIILMLLAVVSENNKYEFSVKSKIWILSIYLGCSVLVKLGMYIFSTPVGFDMICGIQGRYYTPILLLPILCLIKKDNNWKVKYLYEKVIVVSILLNMLTIYSVMRNYL